MNKPTLEEEEEKEETTPTTLSEMAMFMFIRIELMLPSLYKNVVVIMP